MSSFRDKSLSLKHVHYAYEGKRQTLAYWNGIHPSKKRKKFVKRTGDILGCPWSLVTILSKLGCKLLRGLTTYLYRGYNLFTKLHGHPSRNHRLESDILRNTVTSKLTSLRTNITLHISLNPFGGLNDPLQLNVGLTLR